MTFNKNKIIASIAVVGTVAAVVALAGFNNSNQASLKLSGGNRLLQAALDSSDKSAEDVAAFQNFVQKHNRNYLTKEEYSARLGIFAQNLQLIRLHDAAATGYKIGVNKYADMSLEEFSKMMGLKEGAGNGDSEGKFLEPEDEVPDFVDSDTVDDDEDEDAAVPAGRGLQSYPASLDWRTMGVLNPIRNQGSCGSCYAFSSVCSLEAMYKVKKGTLPQLSEQQIVDCSSSYGNSRCSGGLMTNSFNYLKSYKSMTRSSYAYTAVAGTCKYNSMNGVINTVGYKNIAKGDPNAHIAALQTAPVSVAVAASSSVFQLYRGGIISSTGCGTSLNHAVNLVGYGTENGTPYWIVRNSWGSNWGESGYFRVLRSTSNGSGICGILNLSSQPSI